MAPRLAAIQRTWQAGRRLVWPVLEQFSSPASQLLLAPLLLGRMGAEQFGLWMIALSALFAAPLLTHGRSMALMVVVPTHGVCDARLMAQLFRLLRLIGLTTLAVLALGIGLWLWLPFLDRFEPGWLLAYGGLVVALLAIVEFDNALACALKGHARFDLAAVTEVTGRGLHVGSCVLLIGAGTSVLELLLVTLGAFALKAAMKWWAVRRLLGAAAAAAGAVDAGGEDITPELRMLGRWNCLQVVSGLAFYAFDRWIVGYTLGAAQVGAYAIVALYAQFAHSISAAAAQVLIPWVARRLGSDASQAERSRVIRIACIAAVFCCLPITLAWALSTPALSLWIDPAFAQSAGPLVDRLSLAFLLLCLNIPFVNLLFGLRQARFVSLLSALAGALLVAVALAWRPEDTLSIANLKVGYSMIVLLSVAQFMRLMRSPSPKNA